jgi:hypothetical protein
MRFLNSDFFHEADYTGPLSIPLGPFRIFTKICRDIRNCVFIAGVNDQCKLLFSSHSAHSYAN